MCQMTANQLIALLDSHKTGDRERFRSVALQAIAHLRSDRDRERARKSLSAITDDDDEPQKLAMQVLGRDAGLVYQLPPIELNNLWLSASTKAEVLSIIGERSRWTDLLRHNIPLRTRILLHGPPGNGKTSLASALAGAMHMSAFGMLISNIRGSLMGETGKHVSSALKLVDNSNALLFLDEFDAIAIVRNVVDSVAGHEQNAVVSTLLQALDRRPLGVVVAATNRLDMIDSAILRRFDSVIAVEPPTPALAREFTGSLFERHNWPIGNWVPSDMSSFSAIERDAIAFIRGMVLTS